MNLLAALATFKCVISLIDPTPQPSITQGQPMATSPVGSHQEKESYSPEQGLYSPGGASYTPGADGRYLSIGLPDYTMPQTPTAPQKKGEVRREMIAKPRPPVNLQSQPPSQGQTLMFDDSFELI